MLRRNNNNNIGEASSLLRSNNNQQPTNNNNNNRTARSASGVRSGSTGGPTITSYAQHQQQRPSTSRAGSLQQQNQQNHQPRTGVPPQPTPRSRNSTPSNNTNRSNNNTLRTTSSRGTNSGLNTSSRSTATRLGQPNQNNNNNNNLTSASSKYIMSQQQQHIVDIEGQKIDLFPRDLADRHNGDFKTSEARASLRLTVENERQLQELVKARRDRALEVLAMYKDESNSWQGRIDELKSKLQREESRRIDLATQARDVETQALNLRHQLRQTQAQARKKGEISSRSSRYTSSKLESGDEDKPVSIIKQVLQRFSGQNNNKDSSSSSFYLGDDDEDDDFFDNGDDMVYAAILGKDLSQYDNQNDDGNNNNTSWFTNAGQANKRKKQKLTKHERIQAAGKIAEELEKSIRTTRLSLESRAAELEASLSEITSLENQKIGFGSTVEEMRGRVQHVHNTVKQAAWMRSCLPLLEQTVRQREGLAQEGEEYGRRVIDSLMALNKRDDENCQVLQEKAERNLFKPNDVVLLVQEENQHMSRELGEAVRDAESWRAQMNATSEKYQEQLREVEKAIDEASKHRRASTF